MKNFTTIFLIVLLALFFNCDKDNPTSSKTDQNNTNTQLTSADREKFIGNWAGTYECTSFPGDTLIINAGSGDLDFLIALHAFSGVEPDFINGELTQVNVITIPEQIIAYFEGSGEITYNTNGTLSLAQMGFGLTCRGSNYVKY